ncbi:helix-turn-helix domain-containing protein [Herbaspirillum sp. alder98]|uniref:helix-turn-helix domain-containing protein n=1 Tax=Herbaspirillum sp. alder98 TaxID=2913096 RepID=UPI001CD82CEA|nr:helix-turn-helix domain-containing protein [Herbaspirillum sp. alder98]MCA1324064.1 helix-turn-helix domain-containing protein [Herbaspirillum sp. alder98]
MAGAYTTTVGLERSRSRERYAIPQSSAAHELRATLLAHEHFSVAGEARSQQAQAWSDRVGRLVDTPVSRAQAQTGFHGELDSYVLPDMIYLESRTDPLLQMRTLGQISRDNVRNFVFHVAVEGIMETVVDPTRQRKAEQFVPGILALDMGQPMRMHRPTRARVLAFFMPRDRVTQVIDDPEALHGKVISYTSPMARLLLPQLQALCAGLPQLAQTAPQQAGMAIHQCAELILAAFARHDRLSGGGRAAARHALKEQIRRHIGANLHRGELAPEDILVTFGLPRATLYRMFEADGGLLAYIRQCRLSAAAIELVEMPNAPVAEIAYGLGFSSASDFTRAFRRSYGMAPQEFRAGGAHWLRGAVRA